MDEERAAARKIRGNVTEGGRYGDAPDRMHMEPEVAPATGEDADVRLPDALPGDLPENNARDPLAERPPRDTGVVRMPEATAEALEEGKGEADERR